MQPTEDMASMGRTTIQVSEELADELYERKQRGDSYEDVIWRLLDTEPPESRDVDDADLVADPADADTLSSPAEEPDAFISPGPAFESEQVPENRRRKPTDDTEGFMPPVVALEFDKQATDKRVMVVEEWLEHVRDDGRVQKSDFEAWYTDEHADRTGYEPGGFWDFFVKPAMRQVEGIDQPNSRTYVWVGRE